MLRIRFSSPVGTPSRSPLKATAMNIAALLRRSEPIRCALISLLSVGLGVGILRILLPILPSDGLQELINAHLPHTATHPLLFWLSLCRARFPFWLLLALAGLTRFSGSLTSAVLIWRGLCDGAAMGLVWSVAAGDTVLPLPDSLSAYGLLAALAAWCLSDMAIRLVQTVCARRMARVDIEANRSDGRMDPSLREALWTYAAFSLATLCATLATCGGYAAILFRFC